MFGNNNKILHGEKSMIKSKKLKPGHKVENPDTVKMSVLEPMDYKYQAKKRYRYRNQAA